MSGIGDSMGAVIEGGLIARAVEPSRGEASEHTHAPTECLNCGAMVTGAYCGACGQKVHIHRSLAAIGHDIMHGVLHLDGKLWNTLPLLTFKPGNLTRRFIEGERAKFVSPMAMFLFSVFAMFAVFQMVGLTVPTDFGKGFIEGGSANESVSSNIAEQITDLQKERDELPRGDARLAEIDAELAALTRIKNKTTAAARDDSADFTLTGIGWLDDGVIAKWKKNPGLMLYKLQANGYKFSWLLIPLSIPFVWLMFAWRRQFKAYDHAVFVTYSLAFMSLLFIAMSLISLIPGGAGWAALLLTIGAPLHLYKQLRHAYGLTRFSALWRFGVLIVFSQIVLILFLQALLVLGAF
ncbi:MAG: DUF3667 domain-containing protein [Erythrobacter sp.]